jgi:hypothetical protein
VSTPRVPADREADRPADREADRPASTVASGERAPSTAVIDERPAPTAVIDERPAAPSPDERDTVANPTVVPGTRPGPASTEPTVGDAASELVVPVDDEEASLRGADARRIVVARQREAFGGVKLGSALFGWLTATGTAAILTGAVAGIGAVLGFDTPDRAAVITGVGSENLGWIAVAVFAVILLASYWCGGYVAARMARFNGAVQGLAVWVWALVIAIVVSLVSVIIGSQVDVLSNADLYPRLSMSPEEFTIAGLVTSAVVLVASLAGAVLGGMSGTRYHRRVDRAGFADES